MGYDPGSDNGAEQWRDVYWTFGQSLIDMMARAEAEQRWDILGLGYMLKGWGWMVLTDMHGEIIIKEAFDQTRFTFDYDSQELCVHRSAAPDRCVDQEPPARPTAPSTRRTRSHRRIYAGDRTKWLKLAYGLRAMAKDHLSNKSARTSRTNHR